MAGTWDGLNEAKVGKTCMENFSKPGAAGIIEKWIDGGLHVLIQERVKDDAPGEAGLFEIPAGKIREFENIYDCLRREVYEETGLRVTEIEGESEAVLYENNGYSVLSYQPFASAQNIRGHYPIMVQTFICKAVGEVFKHSAESANIRWVAVHELGDMLEMGDARFYPMHVITLKRYLKVKLPK